MPQRGWYPMADDARYPMADAHWYSIARRMTYGVDTGGNPARFASNPLGNGAHTWAVADPQGSPRYTQDDSGQPTNAGTPAGTLNYDPQPTRYAPYGAIDLGADGNGQVPQTFGYRGEVQDANTGLVNLRARTYNPATGQFLTRDPLEPQTGQAYAYAGGNPIANADPSGQYYQTAQSAEALGPDRAVIEQAIINDFVRRDTTRNSVGPVDGTLLQAGPSNQAMVATPAHAALVSFTPCHDPRCQTREPAGYARGETFDLTYSNAGIGLRSAAFNNLHTLALTKGLTRGQVRGITCPLGANGTLIVDLFPGYTYPLSLGDYVAKNHSLLVPAGGNFPQYVGPGPPTAIGTVTGRSGQQYAVYAYQRAAGFIGYYACYAGTAFGDPTCQSPTTTCAVSQDNAVACALDALSASVDDLATQPERQAFGPGATAQGQLQFLTNLPSDLVGTVAVELAKGAFIDGARVVVSNGSTAGERLLALTAFVPAGLVEGAVVRGGGVLVRVGGVAARFTPVAKTLEGLQALGRRILAGGSVVAQRVGDHLGQAGDDVRRALGEALSNIKRLITGACAYHCFPAGTLVATPRGHMAIERLHIGDLVLAEDPTTGKVEAEPVQAVIVRAKSDLMAVDLSDGSSLKVTTNHLFWVDAGPQRTHAGWVLSGDLRVVDRLRTTAGKHVLVVRVRRHVGQAVVYTLTVAQDHTFFVGSARVLVHNAGVYCGRNGSPNGDPLIGQAPGLSGPEEAVAVTNLAQRGILVARNLILTADKITDNFWNQYAEDFRIKYGWANRRIPFGNAGLPKRLTDLFTIAEDELQTTAVVNGFGVDSARKYVNVIAGTGATNPLTSDEISQLATRLHDAIHGNLSGPLVFDAPKGVDADIFLGKLLIGDRRYAGSRELIMGVSNPGGACPSCVADLNVLGQSLNRRFLVYHYGN